MILRALGGALPLAVALTAPATVEAQVYRVTDEQGNVVFTDRPPSAEDNETVERVEVTPINRSEPVAVPTQNTATAPAATEPPPEPTVSINAPENESTIAMGPGNFTVSAAPDPQLGAGETLQLLMDGEAIGEPQRDTSWFLEGILRGPHDLVVERRAAGGRVIARSEPVRVYVLRPSIR